MIAQMSGRCIFINETNGKPLMGFKPSGQMWLVLCTIMVLLIPSIISIPLYAQELRTEDYTITDFGLRNGNTPFITVEGKAGGSYDESLDDEGYKAYVFKTDKGNFMITVSEGFGTNLYYSANHLLSNNIKLNETKYNYLVRRFFYNISNITFIFCSHSFIEKGIWILSFICGKIYHTIVIWPRIFTT